MSENTAKRDPSSSLLKKKKKRGMKHYVTIVGNTKPHALVIPQQKTLVIIFLCKEIKSMMSFSSLFAETHKAFNASRV